MSFYQDHERARGYGKRTHPEAPEQYHMAFANAVAYAMNATSEAIEGPSMRERRAKQVLYFEHDIVPGGTRVLSFESAAVIVDSICYGPMTEPIARIGQDTVCYDDAPDDVEAARHLLGSTKPE